MEAYDFSVERDHAMEPFNPLYDPMAKTRYALVTASMVDDGYYETHSRQECKEEWGRRYDLLKKEGA